MMAEIGPKESQLRAIREQRASELMRISKAEAKARLKADPVSKLRESVAKVKPKRKKERKRTKHG